MLREFKEDGVPRSIKQKQGSMEEKRDKKKNSCELKSTITKIKPKDSPRNKNKWKNRRKIRGKDKTIEESTQKVQNSES